MTNLIATDLQGQEVDSPILDLFELTYGGNTYYFHAGVEEDLTTVQFRDKESPSTIRTYTPIPIIFDGMEISSSGAVSRPNLTVANVTSDLKNTVGITRYKDLIGATLVRRQTLQKYLYGESGDANPPVELNSLRYKIDRVASETNIAVSFELAVVYDLEGITLPRRTVIGKFCSWMYQGQDIYSKGGCVWKSSNQISETDSGGTSRTHTLFFDEDDVPLILDSWLSNASNAPNWATGQSYTQSSYVEYPSNSGNYYRCEKAHTSSSANDPSDGTGHWLKVRKYTTYSSSTTYNSGDLVNETVTVNGKSLNTIWKCIATGISNKAPSLTSAYWEREELCGKKLSSCKCRFQAIPVATNVSNQPPSAKKDSSGRLPFGAFPGALRF